jgi:hypothetical protein
MFEERLQSQAQCPNCRRALAVVKQALSVLHEVLADDDMIRDDLILSSGYIFDVTEETTHMLEKLRGKTHKGASSILDQARQKVADLEIKAREALEIKKELEAEAAAIRDAANNRVFTIQTRVRFGSLFANTVSDAPPPPREAPAHVSEEVGAWLRNNAPELLPQAFRPSLTIEQQAKFAHAEYVDCCYQWQAAKHDLARLQRRVDEVRDLLRCVVEEESAQ